MLLKKALWCVKKDTTDCSTPGWSISPVNTREGACASPHLSRILESIDIKNLSDTQIEWESRDDVTDKFDGIRVGVNWVSRSVEQSA